MCGEKMEKLRWKLVKVDRETVRKLERGFVKLEADRNCNSLLKKHLHPQLFDKLKRERTAYGSTLLDVVQSGFYNPDCGIGVYAPDPDAYSVYAQLLDPIIEDYHKGFTKESNHPALDFGNPSNFANLDPDGNYVLSTRVRVSRSLENYPFNPSLTQAQYKEILKKVSSACKSFYGDLKGTFHPLSGMSSHNQKILTENHFLFKNKDRFLQGAQAYNFWPAGRGLYYNNDKTFLIWINEEDHLRIISMQMGADLASVYSRLIKGIQILSSKLRYSRSPHLGYLTMSPSNLGTGLRASVHMKLPKLGTDFESVLRVAGSYALEVREIVGSWSAQGPTFDVSTKRRLGLSEFQIVKSLYDGVNELIKLETAL